jgi:DNA-binding NtrC family response regulator
MRILVVDDEQSLLMTLVANLELEGFEVVSAPNGAEALELFEQQSFDLVLTDIRMPGMNGVQLFRTLRARRSDLPVILMTAFALEGLVQEAVREGAFTVLPKPFEIDHVVGALTRAARAPVVLLIDGDAQQAGAIAAKLEDVGVRARYEGSVDAAVTAVADGEVDVCVIDLAVAGRSGNEVAQRLREANPAVSLIAVGRRDVAEMMRKAAASGVFACLKKPVATNDLIDVIARARSKPVTAAR